MSSEAIDWAIVIDVAQWVTTLGIGFFVWISSKQRATRGQIDQVKDDADKRLDNQEARIITIEEHIRHMPKTDDFRELSDRIHQLHGDLREVSTNVKNFENVTGILRDQLGLIDEFLRRQKP